MPIANNHALTSDNIEFTWAEIGKNPILPSGKKNMHCVNLTTIFKLNNGTSVAIGHEKSNDINEVHLKIFDIYKELFDNDMQMNYNDLDIKSRFSRWIHHVDDCWKQRQNIFRNKSIWNLDGWKKYSEEILPNLI